MADKGAVLELVLLDEMLYIFCKSSVVMSWIVRGVAVVSKVLCSYGKWKIRRIGSGRIQWRKRDCSVLSQTL